ncbi:MAG TPA: hypothetical protein VD837_11120 [Terriglobales bacterium]|nr:hypothetical protein [Terriglobales bacterium]
MRDSQEKGIDATMQTKKTGMASTENRITTVLIQSNSRGAITIIPKIVLTSPAKQTNAMLPRPTILNGRT